MNLAAVESIVRAALYEGYILYPYRPSSVKNQQRWTFGCLFPEECAARCSGASSMRTECLLKGGPETSVEVRVRFLALVKREVAELPMPVAELESFELPFEKVASLTVGEKVFLPWEEAAERDIAAPEFTIAELIQAGHSVQFSFPAQRSLEPLRDSDGLAMGALIRSSQNIGGTLTVAALEIEPSVFKLTVRIRNTTPLPADCAVWTEAQKFCFVSTHTILGVKNGAFISPADPPHSLKEAAAGCANEGTWPVLAGDPGAADMMLSSPIILYDYPQVAPESPGDLFDATEIDEILTLRILSMTDEEKREMAAADPRARALLERTEALTPAEMERLHGALRDPRFGMQASGLRRAAPPGPQLAYLRTGGRDLKVGDRVRLRPKAGADIMDIVLKDELAVIEAIERDFEDRVHVAVVLEADPGRELGLDRMPGHRFFFSPDEIEPTEKGERT